MKNRLVFLVVVAILFSCSKSTVEQKYEAWKLVEMTGQMVDSKQTGADMAWQESYQLKPNGTFVKQREKNGVSNEASGSYKIEALSDGKYLMLTYDGNNPIIGNCDGGLKEALKLESDNKLRSSWWACDGPGLLYEKTEQNRDIK